MKKLIYIDNQPKHSAEDGFDTAQTTLNYLGVNADGMQLIHDFKTGLTDLEREAILFNPEHVIVTQSLFSEASFDSYQMLVDYLTAAGEHNIQGIVMLDLFNKLPRAINRIIDIHRGDLFGNLDEVKNVGKNFKNIRKAISNNKLITFEIISRARGVSQLTINRARLVQTPVNLTDIIF